MIAFDRASSPFGDVVVALRNDALCMLRFVDDASAQDQALAELLGRYRAGKLVPRPSLGDRVLARIASSRADAMAFGMPIHLDGTAFENSVWQALLKVPFGVSTTYGALAEALGNPGAARAVGRAVGRNGIALVVPCHRVVRSDGAPGGYRWGTERKARILAWERSRASR